MTVGTRLRILLADDHTLLRQGLRKILQERPDWEVVAEAGDGREAVRQTLAVQHDIAILDIGMPLLNGIEATRQIVRRLPDIRVLILSMHANEAYIIQALKAGAKGYLLKDSADTDLIRGVAAVASLRGLPNPRLWRADRIARNDRSALDRAARLAQESPDYLDTCRAAGI